MLGSGRPFVLSLFEARKSLSVPSGEEIQRKLNSLTELVQVRDLRIADENYFEQLKTGEEDKLKAYCAVVWTSRTLSEADISHLNSLKDVVIHQKTPIRVLHRRSLLIRERKVLEMHSEQLSANLLRLNLVTTAGTYVKEFVHGDFGRTSPHIGALLGCRADIVQLDVLGLATDREELSSLIKTHSDSR